MSPLQLVGTLLLPVAVLLLGIAGFVRTGRTLIVISVVLTSLAILLILLSAL